MLRFHDLYGDQLADIRLLVAPSGDGILRFCEALGDAS